MDCSTPSFSVLHHLPELAQTRIHWVGDAIQPSHPLSSPSLPAFKLSQHQGLFQWVGSLYQMAKVLELQPNISPYNKYSGLISFRIDLFDLLAVQGTLKSLLQHHSSKGSILWHLAFFMVQLSHLYMTTGKAKALTRHVFVSKVMSLIFNMLPRFVIAFFSRSTCLLISWLQLPSTVILEPKKIKSATVSTGSNLGLLHYRQTIYHLSHQGSLLSSRELWKSVTVWRAGISDDCDILVYWYGRKYFISQRDLTLNW